MTEHLHFVNKYAIIKGRRSELEVGPLTKAGFGVRPRLPGHAGVKVSKAPHGCKGESYVLRRFCKVLLLGCVFRTCHGCLRVIDLLGNIGDQEVGRKEKSPRVERQELHAQRP